MKQHTPTPWTSELATPGKPNGNRTIRDANGHYLFDMGVRQAPQLLRAVNSFDAMRNALKTATAAIPPQIWGSLLPEQREQIVAALALANGENIT